MGFLWCYILVHVTLIQTVFCKELTLNYDLQEEQNPDTFVGNIARDSKLYTSYSPSDFQLLRYSLFTQASKVAKKFSIDASSSTIRTTERLDREDECRGKKLCTLSIDVEVYMVKGNTETPDLKTIIRVNINLLDINDNAPTFPKNVVTLTVPESVAVNQELLTSGAVDLDTGENNSVESYELIPSDGMFGLKVIENSYGPADLGLVVKQSLDRETRSSFSMAVVAKDGGYPQRSGSVTINVVVADVNDNRPLFVKEEFNVTVPEDTPMRTVILILTATDPDSDENGQLAYKFSDRTSENVKNVFTIDKDSGELSPRKKLDYEEEKEYRFRVEVSDLGNPSRSSQATVTVHIADVDDNAPQIIINMPPSSKDISEDTERGTFIAHVSVFDADSGNNGKVSCQIHDNHFVLQKFSDFDYYKILLNRSLDYEESPTHTVNITCEDGGIVPRKNSSSFTVKVKDVNDNPPSFNSDRINAHIRENNRYSDIVTILTATDPDGPGNNEVLYSIISDPRDLVNLDSRSGEVRAAKIYDRESMPSFTITVKAEDAKDSRLSSTAVLSVFIDDDNDKPPRFTLPHFRFYVSESQHANSVIGKLNATDRDVDQNFSFSFSERSNVSKYFSIDSNTGIIRNKERLDREDHLRFDFGVVVSDPNNSQFKDKANVTVFIKDWNDNTPIVVFPSDINNTVYVPYHRAVGSIILVIQAFDNDTEDNAKLTYTIEQGNDKELFFLNLHSGEMYIAKEMHSTDTGTYKLVVAAHDSGEPQLTSYANLNIIITASNASLPFIIDNDAHQYIAIVITLVCVTSVLCVAVIITICIIKKIDKERRQTLKEKMQTQAAYTVDNVETMETGVSPNKPYENEIDKLKRKIKRELSFTVDDSHAMDTTAVTGASFATFKNMTSYSSIDQKTLANPQACSSVLTNNTHTPEHTNLKMAHYAEKKREIHRLASERIQELDCDTAHWLSETEVKKADDVTSELSQGAETDSGRGCSEEDSQSNRGSAVPHSDSDDVKTYSPRYQPGRGTYVLSRDTSHDTTRSTNSQLSLRSAMSPRLGEIHGNHYPRNISFSDDSVTANTTVDAKRKKRLHGDNIPMQTFARSERNASQTPYHLRAMNRVRFTGHTPNQGTFIDVTESTPGMRYSIGDMDDVLCDSAMTMHEDDERTTTSGSYTINAEELCNEIDNLFFKDIIV
ncbi:protocadherin-11 X-linked-like isoform X1 [Haliotis cracherodii]|uniref:protocadherin-11 X-linked-like isoform X1 n=1 Tax=Haliotis cracherodii TaxID=6455 RepID=UPI0039E75021